MGIKVPSYRLVSQWDLKHLRRRLKGSGRGKHSEEEHISLTSLIDVFSILLFFLIQSFSATGEIFFANKDIKIPTANYAKELTRSPVVTIMPDKVTIEGLKVGDNSSLQDKVEEKDWDLPLLSETMNSYKRIFEDLHPGVTFPGSIIIQADESLDFVFLKRVMFALVKSGYGDIKLAVRGEVNYGNSAAVVVPPKTN